MGIPPEKDFEWRYRDEFLAYFKLDLIHVHYVQRLTGTLLESAAALQIPYVVAVHDAWWLPQMPVVWRKTLCQNKITSLENQIDELARDYRELINK